MIIFGGALGKSRLGSFGLGRTPITNVTTTQTQSGVSRIQITSTKTQSGIANLRNTTIRNQSGVSNIINDIKTITGVSRIQTRSTKTQSGISSLAYRRKKVIFGKSYILAANSIIKEFEIITQGFTDSESKTEFTMTGLSKNVIISTSFGRFRKEKKVIVAGQSIYKILSVLDTDSFEFFDIIPNKLGIFQENLNLSNTNRTENILSGLSKNAIISNSLGAYRKHKNVILSGYNLGRFQTIHTAEYKIPAGVGLQIVPGTGFSLTQALEQEELVYLNPNKLIPVDETKQYNKFQLFPTTYTSWPAISDFSFSLDGHTAVNSTLNSFSLYFVNAILLSRILNIDGGFLCNGSTSILIDTAQSAVASWTATGSTNVSFTVSQLFYLGLNADGTTSFIISALKTSNGFWEADGLTDILVTADTSLEDGWHGDGTTSVSLDPIKQVTSSLNMDGSTQIDIDTRGFFVGNINADGTTSVTINSNQIYTSNNIFNLDGITSLLITANQDFGFGVQVNADGIGTFAVVNANKVLEGTLESDGATSVVCDTVADYFIHISADGQTTVQFASSAQPNIQIVCTGVGDLFIDALKAHVGGLNADGTTSVSESAYLLASAAMNWAVGTNVSIDTAKQVNAFINADGSTDLFIEINQDLFGTIHFDQLDQILSAIGSFILADGSLNIQVISSFIADGIAYVLGPDYISGIIVNNKETESPNFIPGFNPSDSFTTSSKTSRSGTGYSGIINYKRVLGFTRPISDYYRKPLRSDLEEEYVKFNLFVENALDFPEISTSVGFTASSKSSIGGYGIIGRDLEDYATFSVLTNARNSQTNNEILCSGDPNAIISQTCNELLWIKNSNGLTSQVINEVLYLANFAAINSDVVETLAGGDGGNAIEQQVSIEMLHTIKARGLSSQITNEVLLKNNPLANSSQANIEILVRNQIFNFSNVLIQQTAIESLVFTNPNARIQNDGIEALHSAIPNILTNSIVLESLGFFDSNVLDNQVVIELINNSTTQKGLIQSVVIEMLVKQIHDPTPAAFVNNPKFSI